MVTIVSHYITPPILNAEPIIGFALIRLTLYIDYSIICKKMS